MTAEGGPGSGQRQSAVDDRIEIRDLTLHDIAAFAVLRHTIAAEGDFVLPEPAEALADRDKIAERIAGSLSDHSNKRILAFAGGRLVGFISGTRGETNHSRHGVHLAIGVAQAYTGKGIGKRLMDALEVWARNAGVVRLDLRVMVQNKRAVTLYLRCGYCIEGRTRGEYCVDGKLVDGYIMGKILE